jgi:hypothetical protein
MFPEVFDRSTDMKSILVKSADERYLSLKNEINFDREKGLLLISPCLYTREKNNKKSSDIFDSLVKKINGFVTRYREWQAKNWFVEFVEENFEKNNKTKELIKSVKNRGRVSSSELLEIFIEKEYRALPAAQSVNLDGSLRNRYLLKDKEKIINKLLSQDLSRQGFVSHEINAFLNFFHFSDTSWTPESFDDVMKFLNRYSDIQRSSACIFVIPNLNKKVEEMQKKAVDFQARKEQIEGLKARNRSGLINDDSHVTSHSRKDLHDFLAEQWGCSESENGPGSHDIAPLGTYLKISFLRYLRQGTKIVDEEFLRNLRYFPKAIQSMPAVYGFPENKKNSELRKIFDEVVCELGELRGQMETNEHENTEFDKDMIKKIMERIIFSSPFRNEDLRVFVFPAMMNYLKTGDEKIISDNRSLFENAANANIENVEKTLKFSAIESQMFRKFIDKLKKCLQRSDDSLEF